MLVNNVMTKDLDREEFASWVRSWDELTHLRADSGDCPDTYPRNYFADVFERAVQGMGQVSARYVHRHHSIFAPFYRPLIQESWATALKRDTPMYQIGRYWQPTSK